MDTEQRLKRLEAQMARYDKMLTFLILYAKTTPTGRRLLKIAGIE